MSKEVSVKKILISVFLMLVSGCSWKDNKASVKPMEAEYPTHTYISDEIRKNSEINVLMRCTLSHNEKELKDAATDIAIIKVISIDSADMKLFKAAPTTYGRFLVDKTIYGTIEENSVYTYANEGGFIPIIEYEQIRNPDFYKKTTKEFREKRKNRYYYATFEPAMELKTGRTYLAFMKYHKSKNLYAFLDRGEGLRGINLPAQDTVKYEAYRLDNLKVRNNRTEELESLVDICNKIK